MRLIDLAGGRPAEILLVEDSEDDVIITRRAFERARLKVNLSRVADGVACMAFLRKQGEYAAAPTPDIILLDLNMPVMDGREVMEEIVADKELRHLPVVILTTSGAERDLLEMYGMRCSTYITKPVDFTQFQRVVGEIEDYWFTVAVLPQSTD